MAPDVKRFRRSIINYINNFLLIIFADDGETEDSTEQLLRSQSMFNMTTCAMCHYNDTIVAESASLNSALTEQIKSKGMHHTIIIMT